jgi:hypothetical protein
MQGAGETTMLLGMSFEREPLQFFDIPSLLMGGIQGSAPFAWLGMLLLLILSRFSPTAQRLLLPQAWMRNAVWLCLLVCTVGMVSAWVLWWRASVAANLAGLSGSSAIRFYLVGSGIASLVAGLAGIVGIGIPFVVGNLNLSLRRIWALTRLSFKEGIRRRVLYVFASLLIVLMFVGWFVVTKPEHQLKTYVLVIYLAMTPLLLFAGVLVASFSIPGDIRQQTIHTVLTKPVERFEVVLGRFFGYVGLMTIVLFILSLVGLLYLLRGIDPEAASESLKARDPWYGVLSYENSKDPHKGENVGREWDYRGYISGQMPGSEPPIAKWVFGEPSATLAARDKVRCEFAFDIYRTTKGYENRGVNCSFVFTTWKYRKDQDADILKRRNELKEQNKSDSEVADTLAREFGIFTVPSKQITDFHTLFLDVPGGLFENAIPKDAAERTRMNEETKAGTAPVTIRVRCLSPTQYVGMARHDFYMRQDSIEGTADRFWFAVNFFKGAFGLWLRLCLVIGLAVCLSTYLSGVVSLLIAMLIYVAGYFREFIEQVALGASPGGGPLESLFRLATRSTMAAPLEPTVTTKVAQGGDVAFSNLVRVILNMIPDIDRFVMTDSVAEGFNIPLGQLLAGFVLLIQYLLPWFVLAYFTMKCREIASAT